MTTQTKYPFQPFKEKIVPPPTTNEGDVCLRFDLKWIPYVFGALKALAFAQTYTSENERAVNEANEMIARAMELAECGMECGDISFSIDEFGHLIFTCEGNDIDLGNVVGPQGEQGEPGDEGPQGIQGIPGIDGQDGAPGDEGRGSVFSPPAFNDTNQTTAEMACAVSDWIRDWSHEKWLDLMDGIQAALDLGKTIADVTADVVNAFLQFTVFGDEALEAAKDMVDGAITYTIDVLQALDTEEFQEQVRCCFYCALLEHSGGFGTSWNDVMANVVECVGTGGVSGIYPVYAFFLSGIALQTYQLQASLAQDVDSTCGPCSDCPEITFTYDVGTGPATASIGDEVIFTSAAHDEPPSNVHYNVQVHCSPCCHLEYVSSAGWTDNDGAGGNVSWNAVDCGSAAHNQTPPANIADFGTKPVSLLGINSVTSFTVTFRVHA